MDSADYPPFYSADGGGIVGFDVDLVGMIAEELGVSLDVYRPTFAELILGVQSGRCDIAASALVITEERARQVQFSDPYYIDKAGDEFAVAANLANTELIDVVNDVLTSAKADGRYDSLYKRWFGINPPK